jgi:hypothetical protein
MLCNYAADRKRIGDDATARFFYFRLSTLQSSNKKKGCDTRYHILFI